MTCSCQSKLCMDTRGKRAAPPPGVMLDPGQLIQAYISKVSEHAMSWYLLKKRYPSTIGHPRPISPGNMYTNALWPFSLLFLVDGKLY